MTTVVALTNGKYPVQNSLRFRSSANAYLNRTPAGAGNTTTWTWSGWIKRGTLTTEGTLIGAGVSAAGRTLIYIDSTDHLVVSAVDSSITRTLLVTNAVYRDPSAWYHVVVAYDETNGTSSNRVKLYVNGQQVTAFSTATYPPGSAGTYMNSANAHAIGRSPYTSASYFDGYIAETVMVDGQALTPSSFGTYDTNGVWQPIKYSGTYGTNGFYLPFSNTTSTTTLVQDSSGNGNNWTPNNISLTAGSTYDSMNDSPTVTSATVANYCVLNPLDHGGGSSVSLINNGNLQFGTTADGAGGNGDAAGFRSTIGVTSGKWYVEGTKINTTTNQQGFGFGTPTIALGVWNGSSANNLTTSNDQFIGFSQNSANAFIKTGSNAATIVASSLATAQNTVYAIAVDFDALQVSFYVNGSQVGSTTSFTKPTTGAQYFITFSQASTWNYPGWAMNFGQRPFAYTPPTGFNALNTYNLPTPTIANGAQYMAATTYTGNGSTQTVTNGGNNTIGTTFQPDFVWVKCRSVTTNHILVDSVRGVTKDLQSNTTAAEATVGDVSALNSNGFTAQYVSGETNANGSTYVGWQWKAGGTALSNTAGSITSSVSANPTAGFSVVAFTAPASGNFTVGHGLNASPAMMILKDRAAVVSWAVWHKSLSNPAQSYLALSNTNAAGANTTVWGNTAPTSTVMTLGVGGAMNASDATVAYCFSEVAGYSAFGSYTGNGSADGPFVYVGFRPRYVLIKRTDSTGDWYIWDTSRNTYNVVGEELLADTSGAGNTATDLDILSNGFKIRTTTAAINASGGTFVYAAFAENPLNYSRAR